MTASWLTNEDVQNYGNDLIDLTQRSALHAVAPHLENLEAQNAELRQRLAREARHRLDQQVAAALPDFRERDRDPEWHRWLLGYDTYSGRVRQQLLNEAIASGSAERVVAFFRGFQAEAGGTQSHASAGTTYGRARSSGGRQIYTRDQIKQLYRAHQQGAYTGREQEWARQEVDIIRASAEGRIVGGLDTAGK
jgi:hypothetical protein